MVFIAPGPPHYSDGADSFRSEFEKLQKREHILLEKLHQNLKATRWHRKVLGLGEAYEENIKDELRIMSESEMDIKSQIVCHDDLALPSHVAAAAHPIERADHRRDKAQLKKKYMKHCRRLGKHRTQLDGWSRQEYELVNELCSTMKDIEVLRDYWRMEQTKSRYASWAPTHFEPPSPHSRTSVHPYNPSLAHLAASVVGASIAYGRPTPPVPIYVDIQDSSSGSEVPLSLSVEAKSRAVSSSSALTHSTGASAVSSDESTKLSAESWGPFGLPSGLVKASVHAMNQPVIRYASDESFWLRGGQRSTSRTDKTATTRDPPSRHLAEATLKQAEPQRGRSDGYLRGGTCTPLAPTTMRLADLEVRFSQPHIRKASTSQACETMSDPTSSMIVGKRPQQAMNWSEVDESTGGPCSPATHLRGGSRSRAESQSSAQKIRVTWWATPGMPPPASTFKESVTPEDPARDVKQRHAQMERGSVHCRLRRAYSVHSMDAVRKWSENRGVGHGW